MKKNKLRLATRKSPLALWQATFIKTQLETHFPELEIVLLPLITQGDKWLDSNLNSIGGKGLFLKELEQALLNNKADIAVHSLKDVPVMPLPNGLIIQTICARDNPLDAFVSSRYADLASMPPASVVGTSSLRRQSQLLHYFPHLTVKNLRGNVNTRLEKLDRNEFDALLLAQCGLTRLNYADRIQQTLPPELFVPAVGQGALCIECRSVDTDLRAKLDKLHDPDTADCVAAERACAKRLGGNCQTPIGAYATLTQGMITLNACILSPDGQIRIEHIEKGPRENATTIGEKTAQALIDKGAAAILECLHHAK